MRFIRNDEQHVFTFGSDQHPVRNACVLITGCDLEQARGIMIALYGTEWARQYDGPVAEAIVAGRAKYPYTMVRVINVGSEMVE